MSEPVRMFADALADATYGINAQLAKQENEAIQQMANEVVDLLNQIAVRCEEGYQQAYGQPIPAAGGVGQQPPPQANPQDQEMLKRFVSALTKDAKTATPKKTEYGLKSIAKGLSDASMKRQLSPEEIHRLGHWAKRLLELVDEGKAAAAMEIAVAKSAEPNDSTFFAGIAELLEAERNIGKELQALRPAKC